MSQIGGRLAYQVGGQATLGSSSSSGTPAAPPISPTRKVISYAERNPKDGPISPRTVLEDDRSRVVREYIVPWGQPGIPDAQSYIDAAKDLLGYPVMAGTAGRRFISRIIPDNIPWLISDEFGTQFAKPTPYLWCTSVEVAPAGDCPSDNVWFDLWLANKYGNAFLTASYEALSYKILSDADMIARGYVDGIGNPDESSLRRYVTKMGTPASTMQTLPSGSFVLALDGKTTYPGTPGRLEPQADMSVTWHHVPAPAIGWGFLNEWIAKTTGGAGADYPQPIPDCLGTVNNSDLFGCKKGTLLLTGVVFKPVNSPIGPRIYDVEYRWKHWPAKSVKVLTEGSVTDYQYGHNVVLFVNGTDISVLPRGYYEIITRPTPAGPFSNYLSPGQADDINLYRYRDHTRLFKVPDLGFDPGNTSF